MDDDFLINLVDNLKVSFLEYLYSSCFYFVICMKIQEADLVMKHVRSYKFCMKILFHEDIVTLCHYDNSTRGG
jgi:hypothetical protein